MWFGVYSSPASSFVGGGLAGARGLPVSAFSPAFSTEPVIWRRVFFSKAAAPAFPRAIFTAGLIFHYVSQIPFFSCDPPAYYSSSAFPLAATGRG